MVGLLGEVTFSVPTEDQEQVMGILGGRGFHEARTASAKALR